jgi:hypothetical protein
MIARGLGLLLASMLAFATQANAESVTHGLWATTPDASGDAHARAQFEAALKRRGLGPIEVVMLAPPPPSETAELLGQGLDALRASAFEKAATTLGKAASKALATGGAGLAPGQAASLFFHLAVAIQLASGATYSEPFTAITPPSAKTAYLRAAVLGGGADLDEAASQPVVEASWRLAKSLVAEQPRSTLTINAHPRAKISVDGQAFQPSPAKVPALPYGEHFVRVEEAGHAPWTCTVDLGHRSDSFDVPATSLLAYDGVSAASHAKTKGAAFALLGELRLGEKIEIDLRLFDARTGELRDSTAVALAEEAEPPDLVAAVLRLDEIANQDELARRAADKNDKTNALLPLVPPPPRATGEDGPRFSSDAKGWLSQHWPLATAVGVAVGTALVLGIVVAKDQH